MCCFLMRGIQIEKSSNRWESSFTRESLKQNQNHLINETTNSWVSICCFFLKTDFDHLPIISNIEHFYKGDIVFLFLLRKFRDRRTWISNKRDWRFFASEILETYWKENSKTFGAITREAMQSTLASALENSADLQNAFFKKGWLRSYPIK